MHGVRAVLGGVANHTRVTSSEWPCPTGALPGEVEFVADVVELCQLELDHRGQGRFPTDWPVGDV